MSQLIQVKLAERAYSIHVGTGLIANAGGLLSALLPGRQALLVTDENVGPPYANAVMTSLSQAGFHVQVEVVPAGESTKSLKYASRLYDRLVDLKADRNAVVFALGGGVVGDLAGFVAATYARGIAFVQIPTTLLAMVDSSVGGKVGVDHPGGKNMIGAFHQPTAVLCDLDHLKSLPEREYRCGLAEVVKHGVILDESLFVFMEENVGSIQARRPDAVRHLVVRSCEIKASVVERDERETKGLRAVLNYGHTFAHAFETALGYDLLHHGEAVAIGMICAGRLAEEIGLVDDAFSRRQARLWRELGLPTSVPRELLGMDLIEIMRRDKKAKAGALRFILPTRLGAVQLVEGIEERMVSDVLRRVADESA